MPTCAVDSASTTTVTAVLYAPTWRDDEVQLDPTAELPLALDPAAFAAALGQDHVLLFRSHYLATGRSRVAATPGVHDVSYHPDINELYAAADVMVTDYSSTMFDFAITGRPIVFYPYDRDRYADIVRGFYFELGPDDAPGPIVTTQSDLLETLAGLARTTGAVRRPLPRVPAHLHLARGRPRHRPRARAPGSVRPTGAADRVSRVCGSSWWWPGAGSNRRPSTFQVHERDLSWAGMHDLSANQRPRRPS